MSPGSLAEVTASSGGSHVSSARCLASCLRLVAREIEIWVSILAIIACNSQGISPLNELLHQPLMRCRREIGLIAECSMGF